MKDMMSITEALYPPLVVDYLQGTDKVFSYFQYPDTEQGYLECAKALTGHGIPGELCDVLYEQNKEADASESTLANIDGMRSQETLTVVAGQQIGVLGGPLFVPLKVLTAVTQAERLKRLLGKAVIPVYWLETNDHDFEEIRRVRFLDHENRIRELSWNRDHPQGMCCGSAEVDESLQELIEEFFTNLRQTEFTNSLQDTVLSCYTIGASMATASMRLAARLYSRFGVVLIDPSDSRIRKMLRPILMKELERAKDGNQIFKGEIDKISIDGYTVNVKLEENRANLYAVIDGRRRAVFISESGTVDRAGDPIDLKSAECVPNVFSRSICQDFLLKAVSCVLGPNEIAYHSLLKPLYEYHSVVEPVACIRTLATLVGVNESRQLDKTGIATKEFLLKNKVEIKKSILEKNSSVDFGAVIEEMKIETGALIRRLKEALDPVLTDEVEAALKLAKSKIKDNVESVVKRGRKTEKARLDTLLKRIEYLSDVLLPKGNLQERTFNVLQYLNLYGDRFLERLLTQIKERGPYHNIILSLG